MQKIRVIGLLLVSLLVVTACTALGSASTATGDLAQAPLSATLQPTPTAASAPTATPLPTATPVPTPTPVPVPLGADCAANEPDATAAPANVLTALRAAAQHPGFEGLDVSASVWIEGWGEVLAVNPELRLVPASNQKLLIAIAANRLLDRTRRLRTTMELFGPELSGTDLSGVELVLRAAGDSTLLSADIEAMAAEVAAAGITDADRLVIDIAPYPQPPRASGWLDFQIPDFVGPLSALMIDDNRWSTSDEFLADPATINGELVRTLLLDAGVAVDSIVVQPRPSGQVLAEHLSPSIGDLLRSTLVTSDNQIADLLLMEIGRTIGEEGSLVAGAGIVEAELAALCLRSEGVVDDGSGLSRQNQRSARQFQELLRVGNEAGALMRGQLAASGGPGTLQRRFSAEDAGRVLAKTGTLFDARALSGYTRTDSGRDVVFSILVNGDREIVGASLASIDDLVTTILRIDS